MAKTLDTLVTETLGAQLRMILELQARVEALTAELDAIKGSQSQAKQAERKTVSRRGDIGPIDVEHVVYDDIAPSVPAKEAS